MYYFILGACEAYGPALLIMVAVSVFVRIVVSAFWGDY